MIPRWYLLAGVAVVACASACAAAAAADSGRACIARGEIDRARDFFAAAHAEAPDDRSVTLLYAQSLTDPQEAKELYTELVETQSSPDSVKAEAHARLGGLAYVSGDYPAAVEHYEAACVMRELPECATVLPRARKLLQADIDLNQAMDEKAASRKKAAAPARFTVQTGSYGAKENAERQRRSLEGADIAGAYVAEADVAGSKVYRVRVGSFESRDDAQAFARRRLRSKNIAFSIVKE